MEKKEAKMLEIVASTTVQKLPSDYEMKSDVVYYKGELIEMADLENCTADNLYG